MIIAILSGIIMSIQGVWNTRLTQKTGLWFGTTIIQAVALALSLILFLMARDEQLEGLKTVNKLYTLGGVLSVAILYTVIISIGHLGPTLATMLILIAQICGAYIIQLVGLFDTPKEPFAWSKVLGVGIMVVGILIFQMKK